MLFIQRRTYREAFRQGIHFSVLHSYIICHSLLMISLHTSKSSVLNRTHFMKICLRSSLPLRQCIKLIVKICSFHNSTIQIVPTRDYLQQFLGAMSSNPTFDIFCFVEYHEEYNYDNSTNELRICSYQLYSD